MSKFEMIRKFYQKRLWNISRVRDAVKKGWITEEEFKTVTGEEFAEAET